MDEKVVASTNNLIDLTSGGSKMSGPVHLAGGGTEDMEMCSDEDDEYSHHHQVSISLTIF